MTGGAHADARVRTPPGLGGLGLAAIQSGYGVAAASAHRADVPTMTAAAPPSPVRVTKSRRVRWGRQGRGRASLTASGLSFLSPSLRRWKERYGPERTEHEIERHGPI